MDCPECGSDKTEVKDSRPAEAGVRRRRQCKDCGQRFSTMEQLVRQVQVRKKDGSEQAFQAVKLSKSMAPALEGLGLRKTAEQVAEGVHRRVLQIGRDWVRSSEIAELVMSSLRELDTAAYVRYAVTHRPFAEGSPAAEAEGQERGRRQATLGLGEQAAGDAWARRAGGARNRR